MQFSFDSQLREEDAELFHFSDVSQTRKHVRAAEDLVRDLQGHGYLKDNDHELLDESAIATVTLTFTATGGDLEVPAGTKVLAHDPDDVRNGAVVFMTDVLLNVADGNTSDVAATAEHFGEVYNVAESTLVFVEASLDNFGEVTNADEATGGADHQLTRAAVYRAMSLIMMDFIRGQDDSFWAKKSMYEKAYKSELDRLVAAGVKIDTDGDDEISEYEEDLEHGFHRFHRG